MRLSRLKRSIVRYATAVSMVVSVSIGGSSIALAAGASAQFPTAFSVNYFNNPRTSGNDEIYIQNQTYNTRTLHGIDYCALIYAFYPDQEMVGCCGVRITPNETFTNSIGQLLIAIDEAGPLPLKGTIKVVSTTANGFCDPSGDITASTPVPLVFQSWISHTNTLTSPARTFVTEEPFAQTGEPVNDLKALELQCQTVNGGTPFVHCPGAT
jgi:hypothetical protein